MALRLQIQKMLKICQRQGAIVIKALDAVAGGGFEEFHILFGFHAFCHNGHIKGFGNVNQILQKHLALRCECSCKEHPIQFDAVHSAVEQERKGGVAHAKVIQR